MSCENGNADFMVANVFYRIVEQTSCLNAKPCDCRRPQISAQPFLHLILWATGCLQIARNAIA